VSDPYAPRLAQTEYLSIDDVVQIVEMFSESPLREAVRDLGLLIGAVERPGLKYRGMDVYTPLAMKAAAFMESLARSNALFDGNKRLAWLATNVFLELNGKTVQFSDNEIFSLLRGCSRATSRRTSWPTASTPGSAPLSTEETPPSRGAALTEHER
jgi:death-on-curing protein